MIREKEGNLYIGYPLFCAYDETSGTVIEEEKMKEEVVC